MTARTGDDDARDAVDELSPNARRVLEARYLARDAAGVAREDWPGLCDRVARAVAEAERDFGGDVARQADAFRELLASRAFLPNSPTLMNAGTAGGQLSACFVLPVEDSIESIFDAVKRMALIHRSGGGTGFSFSRLRPRGDVVSDHHGVASGPVEFLDVFDAATGAVRQGGRRRGANMGVLRIDHPDVREFAAVKRDPQRVTNFNLSVAIPDRFMESVERGDRVELINPRNGSAAGSVDAAELLREVSEHAWASGDPGVLFLDAMARGNPTPRLGDFEATNPCGELPLLPDESCTLGSLRLDAFVRDGAIDTPRLEAATALAVRFLDDVVEVTRHPDSAVEAATRGNRKLGLGVMGFADLLVDLGIPYDAPEAAGVARRVMHRIAETARRASARLAEERGVFPHHRGSRLEAAGVRQRNATLTSIAPTGTLSILAGCSSGIEPYFALAYERHVLDGARLPEGNRRFETALRRHGAWSEDLMSEVKATGSVRKLDGVPASVRRLFPTAADLAAAAHLDIQEAFQAEVDNAVSKTINLPAVAQPADIDGIYRDAWRRGLKGVTVFREGCRPDAVLHRGGDDAEDAS